MPTVQSTYADNISTAFAGAQANQEHANLISRTVEDSGGIAFGLAVMQGTNDKGCVVGDGTAFLGLVVRTQSVEDGAFEGFGYLEDARIATKGVFWVQPGGAVNAGDPVTYEADGELNTGSSPQIPNARWDSSSDGAAGNLAKVRLG